MARPAESERLTLSSYVTFNQHGKRMMTLTFGIPRSFYQALAKELGYGEGRLASDPEVQDYLRDVVAQNIDHLVQSHEPKRPTMKVKKRKRHAGE